MRFQAKRFLLAGTLSAAALVGAGFVATGGQAADDPAALIAYRQAIMKANGGHMGAIAMVAKGQVDFVDEVSGHAHAINEMSKHLLELFPEGSGPEAGETAALPVIWEKWSDFQAAVKTLEAESAKLAQVAKTGDLAAIAAQTGQLGNNGCGGCHKMFRKKKE